MVIGLKGVYFKNDWTTKTEKNFLSWNDLSDSNSTISNGALNCISIIPGCEINMSGSSMKKSLLINLLNQIIDLYKDVSSHKSQGTQVERNDNDSNISNDINLIENISGNASTELYSLIIPEIIALCIAADGEAEDSEVELATDIIDNDELIDDKQLALELLLLNVEKLISDKKKSNAIFKLKATTIISKISKITDTHQKERIRIILDGMFEAVGDQGASETKIIIDSIIKKL
jgi:hypothetical protein